MARDMDALIKNNIIPAGPAKWERKLIQPINLIFVGHPNKYQGFDRLIRLIERLLAKCRLKVSCFGFEKTDIPRVLRNSISELDCAFSFELDDRWYTRKYSNGLLINLSRTEGFPSAPLEALGHGIPVLIPNYLPYSNRLSPEYVYDSWHDIDETVFENILNHHIPKTQKLDY